MVERHTGSPAEAKVRKPHQAREEDIRLHEPQLDDYLYKRKEAEADNLYGEEDFGMIFGENEQVSRSQKKWRRQG